MEQRCEIEYNAADADIISQVRKSLNGTTKEKSKGVLGIRNCKTQKDKSWETDLLEREQTSGNGNQPPGTENGLGAERWGVLIKRKEP